MTFDDYFLAALILWGIAIDVILTVRAVRVAFDRDMPLEAKLLFCGIAVALDVHAACASLGVWACVWI